MAIYDWGEKIARLPEDWRATNGRGVKVAIFDTGIKLFQDGIYIPPSRRFNATDPEFDATPSELHRFINGNISGSEEYHGTQLSSILIGRPFKQVEDAEEKVGIKGLIPDAEFYFFRIIDEKKEGYKKYFLNALEAAINLDVDIICNSILPSGLGYHQELFQKLEDKNILFFSSTKNTYDPKNLDKPLFPSDQPNTLLTAGMSDKLINNLIRINYKFNNKIFALPQVDIKVYDFESENLFYFVKSLKSKSSHAVAILSGIAALLLSKSRIEREDVRYRDRLKIIEILKKQITLPFRAPDVLDDRKIGFFYIHDNG
jgi:subtilisin family serine protease